MRITTYTVILAGLLIGIISCRKEYSSEGKIPPQNNKQDTLPVNYPFSTGLCDAVTLGIDPGTISNFSGDTSATMPDSLLLDMPESGDQGSQGSCAAWAVVYGLGSYYQHESAGKAYSDTGNLSPAFTYNQIAKGNCGCTSLIDNLYLLREEGAASLARMTYDPSECSVQPDSLQFLNASGSRIPGFEKVDMTSLRTIKAALVAHRPVVFATTIDDGFKKLSAPYIWSSRQGAEGEGHAMVIIGYDDNLSAFRILNSWSRAWADQGQAWIGYEFLMSNAQGNGFVFE